LKPPIKNERLTAEEILTYTIMMRNDRLLIADWRLPIVDWPDLYVVCNKKSAIDNQKSAIP